jgi:xanthine/uracil permease
MYNMGLSNRVQAVLVGISAGFGAFGAAAAVIPNFVPIGYKFAHYSLIFMTKLKSSRQRAERTNQKVVGHKVYNYSSRIKYA